MSSPQPIKLASLSDKIKSYLTLPQLKRYFFIVLSLAILLILSNLMLRGSGFFPKPEIVDILLLSFLIIIFNSSKKIFWLLLFPFTLIYALYTPIGLNFGGPRYQHVASLVATDLSEGTEFLQQIPIKSYLYALFIPILLILFRKITTHFNINLFKNKLILSVATIYLLSNTAPFKLFNEAYIAGKAVKVELENLNKLGLKNEWGETSLTDKNKYDDYVLIIGESARKDYHHAYGYPIENTPFMSSANGILIDGMTSAGTYTIASLKLMLTHADNKNWKEKYELNLIDLIKSSGITTYWLSNQGLLGQYDTQISALARKSEMIHFLNKADTSVISTSDFKLLPILDNILDDTNKKRFIAIHLYGSHPNPCHRVEDYHKIYNEGEIDKKYHYLNCYVTSIKKTDDFIKQVYTTLEKNKQKTGRSFSIIYFSDHGLCHGKKEDKIIINNGCTSKLHNDIPLFKISSDDTERKVYKAFKSGLNFTNGIANWIGIKNDKLDPNIDLFSPQSDPDDYGLQEQINKRKTPVDPAIDIRPKN